MPPERTIRPSEKRFRKNADADAALHRARPKHSESARSRSRSFGRKSAAVCKHRLRPALGLGSPREVSMKRWICAAFALVAIVLSPLSAFADGALYLARG